MMINPFQLFNVFVQCLACPQHTSQKPETLHLSRPGKGPSEGQDNS